jgi:5-formyltetrahydrofolate cyclo-ligase
MVPLVAFDKKLNRIGYGKGYYDRSLKRINKIKKNVISVGVAYSFQECKNIPIEKHDFKLNYIFTERGIISSNQ